MPFPRITRDQDTTANQPGLSTLTVLPLLAAAALAFGCVPAGGDGPEQLAASLVDATVEAQPLASTEQDAPQLVPDGMCTLEARPAALVHVVDQYGEELSGVDDGATVLFARRESDGGWSEPDEGLCIDADCTRWAIGYATPGEYRIGAYACGDHEVGTIRVGMTDDGCHVDTVTTRLQLEVEPACLSSEGIDTELPCDTTTPAKPSVIAMTAVQRGDMLIPQPPSALTLRHASDSAPSPMNCLDPSCTMFSSQDYGVSGEFRVRAELCGEVLTRSVAVEPEPDGCGVQTEWVGLFSDADQCAVFDYTNEQMTD